MRNGSSPLKAPDNGHIAQEIDRISGLDLAGVRAPWRATFKKEPPTALTRDLLVRQLAWRIQERAFGRSWPVMRCQRRTAVCHRRSNRHGYDHRENRKSRLSSAEK
jgi:DUF2924 family protein